MDMQQAITAKLTSEPPTEPTPLSAADRLDALGRLLYGEQWITPMARDLKIHRDTVAEWAWGRRELPPDHPIFAALAVLPLSRQRRREGAQNRGLQPGLSPGPRRWGLLKPSASTSASRQSGNR